MNLDEIRTLITKAQQGDVNALGRLAEWGVDAALEVMLDDGSYLPAWARTRLISEHAELTSYRTASRGRAAGAATRNAEQSRRLRSGVKAAAALISLHDHPPRHRVALVRRCIVRFGPAHFGLDAVPDDKTLRRTLDETEETGSGFPQ